MKRRLLIALPVIGLAIISIMAWPALFPEKWQLAASMHAPRMEHTATLLLDGRVLVAGGYGMQGYSPLCELYDPQTNRWTVTGNMLSGRDDFTATLLKNGQVLVAGGAYNDTFLSECEIFDPSKGTWRATGSMGHERQNQKSTLLSNGKVLVVGGNVDGITNSELFDPNTEKWSACDSILTDYWPRIYPDGKIILFDNDKNSKIFNERTEKWEKGIYSNHLHDDVPDDPNAQHYAFGETLLSDGKYLVTGGAVYHPNPVTGYELLIPYDYFGILPPIHPYSSFLTDCDLYDPTTGRWSSTKSLQIARMYHTATLLKDGRVLVVGGSRYDEFSLNNTDWPKPFASCEFISVKELER